MTRGTLYRIFGLFALLAVGLMSVGAANALTRDQGAFAGTFNIATSAGASIGSNASEKPVCVHVTERSHESCLACSTSFVISLVSRVRPKSSGPRQKTGFFSFPDIQTSPAAGRYAPHLGAVYGLLSQARTNDTSLFARTGRLRI